MAKEMESEREFYYAMLQQVEGLLHEADELKSATIDKESLRSILYQGNKDTEQNGEENPQLQDALAANLDDTETF